MEFLFRSHSRTQTCVFGEGEPPAVGEPVGDGHTHVIEAAAIDGASPAKRFWTIAFPLLSPTFFFLLVMNLVYAFCETFGVIHAITEGGPNEATNIMVFKIYHDSFESLDLGGSAAQSVILMFIVISLTVIQFRYIEKKVHY